MPTFINFLLESSLIMTVCVSFYFFVLRRNATPVINRIYLLLTLLVVVSVPFLRFEAPQTLSDHEVCVTADETFSVPSLSEINHPFAFAVDAVEGYNDVLEAKLEPRISRTRLLHVIYLLGLLILFVRVVIGLIKLNFLKSEYKVIKYEGKRLIIAGDNYQPFSFLNMIVVPNKIWKGQYRDGIIAHEAAHIDQKHSLDILLNELILLFQWFNPFAWLNKRYIQENHEFLADRKVVDTVMDVQQYKQMLLYDVMGVRFDMANNFNYSLTKKRFSLLSKHINRNRVLLSSFAGFAVLVSSVFFFACTNLDPKSELNAKTVFSGKSALIYRASNVAGIKVEGVTHTKNYIILDIAPYSGEQAFEITRNTYITPGTNSSIKYKLKKARGKGQLNTISKDHQGFRLYFPKLEENIGTIHLKGETDQSLKIFDIELWDKNRYSLWKFQASKLDTSSIRVVNNPKCAAKSSILKILKVEIGQEYTAIDFEVDVPCGGFFAVPQGSCICPSKGGENLYVKIAKGVELGDRLYVEGIQKYTLIFPPLPEGTRFINFKELNAGGNWAAYEIDLSQSFSKSIDTNKPLESSEGIEAMIDRMKKKETLELCPNAIGKWYCASLDFEHRISIIKEDNKFSARLTFVDASITQEIFKELSDGRL